MTGVVHNDQTVRLIVFLDEIVDVILQLQMPFWSLQLDALGEVVESIFQQRPKSFCLGWESLSERSSGRA